MIIGMESGHHTRVEIVAPYTGQDFSVFLDLLDQLYDAIATRRLDDVSELDKRQVIGWLKDIRVTSGELIDALDQ